MRVFLKQADAARANSNLPFSHRDKLDYRPGMIDRDFAYRFSAATAATGVILGAFGAHGLKAHLTALGTVHTWETAASYLLLHALAMFILAQPGPRAFRRGVWLSFAAGVALFSGSLFTLSITGMRWLGAITPLGGVCFIAGWLILTFRRSSGSPDAPQSGEGD
jgi:uncharacterized membrane protein YgdD (TMEM256/DUF423 family)